MKISLTLDRALQLLDLLGHGPMRASEAADALGLNRTVTHRLLSTLQQHRLIIQVDGRYHLGDGIRPLAQHVETRLHGIATNPATQLAELTGSTVLLTLRSGLLTSVLTFTNVSHREDVHVVPEVGTTYSVATNPHGLAMLAFSAPSTVKKARRQTMDRDRFDRIVARTQVDGWTRQSISPLPKSFKEIAAPLFTLTEFADAALSLIPPEGVPHSDLIGPLLQTCDTVSRMIRCDQS